MGDAERTPIIDAQVAQLDHKLDALADALDRMAIDLDAVSAQCQRVDAALADARVDLQRGFGDLRNALRHVVTRMTEGERSRLR